METGTKHDLSAVISTDSYTHNSGMAYGVNYVWNSYTFRARSRDTLFAFNNSVGKNFRAIGNAEV
jgi:hypothetical protein